MEKFNSEREMQDLFVKALKKKTKGIIYQEVGNMASFFRADVVEYGYENIRCYELKLRDFKSLMEQCRKHKINNRFDLVCAVIPEYSYDDIIWESLQWKCDLMEDLRVYTFDGENIKLRKRGKINKIDVHNRLYIADLIVRGYHMDGKNKRKSYK